MYAFKGPGVFCCENGVTLSEADLCNEKDNCGDGSDESTAAGCSGGYNVLYIGDLIKW